MAVDEQARFELHQLLTEVLWTSGAASLMEHLPPVGWADVARKADLAHLVTKAEMADVRTEIASDRLHGRALSPWVGPTPAASLLQPTEMIPEQVRLSVRRATWSWDTGGGPRRPSFGPSRLRGWNGHCFGWC